MDIKQKEEGVIRKEELRVSRNVFIKNFRDKMRQTSRGFTQRSVGLNTNSSREEYYSPAYNYERRSSMGNTSIGFEKQAHWKSLS